MMNFGKVVFCFTSCWYNIKLIQKRLQAIRLDCSVLLQFSRWWWWWVRKWVQRSQSMIIGKSYSYNVTHNILLIKYGRMIPTQLTHHRQSSWVRSREATTGHNLSYKKKHASGKTIHIIISCTLICFCRQSIFFCLIQIRTP